MCPVRLLIMATVSLNLSQQKAVKITAGICIAGYVACIIVFLTHCHPIYRLWQVYPYPGGKSRPDANPLLDPGERVTDAWLDGCALNIPKYLALVVTNVVYSSLDPPFFLRMLIALQD